MTHFISETARKEAIERQKELKRLPGRRMSCQEGDSRAGGLDLLEVAVCLCETSCFLTELEALLDNFGLDYYDSDILQVVRKDSEILIHVNTRRHVVYRSASEAI